MTKTKMQNRIEFTMEDAAYRAAEGVSISALKRIKQSPAHYLYAMNNPQPRTDAMMIGTLTHRAILEPDQPIDYAVKPDGMSFATKEGKEWRAAQSLPIITAEDDRNVRGMADAVRCNPSVKRWLAHGNAEVSMFADHESGLKLKGRADWLVNDRPIMLDVKTCECALDFEREAAKRYYHVQEAYYRGLAEANDVEIERFVFVVVEKQAPYGVRLVEFNEASVQVGKETYQDWLRTLRKCIADDAWPSYSQEVQSIWLPSWATE